MITVEEFTKIDNEVQNAIREAFEYGRNHEKDKNDFYLFLCNATYRKNENPKWNPYLIGDAKDVLLDRDRFDSLTKYLKKNYSFVLSNTSDSNESLVIEMRMYTHIWESKNFLKKLKRLFDLCNGDEYDWICKIPDSNPKNKDKSNPREKDSKQAFIRDIIRDGFKAKSLKMSNIITNGYRSQLRNAFAHSDYSFSPNEDKISLHNYKPKGYEVKSVTINEWTSLFCHSFLLNYHFHNYYYEERKKIDKPIEVFLKNKDGEKKKGIIEYDNERYSFSRVNARKYK